MPLNTFKLSDFRYPYLLAVLAGSAGLVLLCWAGAPLDFAGQSWADRGGLLLAAAAGFCLRTFRRRVVFGRDMSWHQSLSFEAMIQTARLVSPWLPLRPFETEFLVRELGETSRRQIQAWLSTRDISTWVTVLAGLALLAGLFDQGPAAVAAGVAAAVVLLLAVRRSDRPAAHLRGILAGLACWGSEGFLFVHFAAPLGGTGHAWALYLFFTGLWEISPIPCGIGLVESPALLYPSRLALALPPLLVFHAARGLVLLPFSLLYLHRFKFAVADLFSPEVIPALRRSQRPPGGWPWPEGEDGDGPRISLVIPAYNEEQRLPEFLDSIDAYRRGRAEPMEVIVVDDGSRDRTAALVPARAERDASLRLLRQVPNQGKGAAVRRGMREARGRYVLFADADGATPIAELDRFRPAMADHIEIVVGSRRLEAPGVLRVREGWREMMGSVFYTLVNLLAVPGIRDTQCGFKMFRRDVARQLFSRSTEKGWAFDVEILYLAQRMGYAVREVAVNWQAVEGSKVRPVADSARMFAALFRIRARQSGFLRHAPALRE